ncbi:hypothetical protein, partial [Escherichia coli]
FRDVAAYSQVITSPEQAPAVFHQAIAQAYAQRGVAHLNIPADIIGAKVSGTVPSIHTLRERSELAPPAAEIAAAAELINAAGSVAIFAGNG